MNVMTKTEMVNACADYEANWFFSQTNEEQKELFRQIMLQGSTGFVNYTDDRLFATCVHKGVFLMEE